MKYILKKIKGSPSYLLQVKSHFGEAMLLYLNLNMYHHIGTSVASDHKMSVAAVFTGCIVWKIRFIFLEAEYLIQIIYNEWRAKIGNFTSQDL